MRGGGCSSTLRLERAALGCGWEWASKMRRQSRGAGATIPHGRLAPSTRRAVKAGTSRRDLLLLPIIPSTLSYRQPIDLEGSVLRCLVATDYFCHGQVDTFRDSHMVQFGFRSAPWRAPPGSSSGSFASKAGAKWLEPSGFSVAVKEGHSVAWRDHQQEQRGEAACPGRIHEEGCRFGTAGQVPGAGLRRGS